MNYSEDTIRGLETGNTSFEGYLLSDRYKIIRKPGEGGMGAVFLAEDTHLDNASVAIKSLPLIVECIAKLLTGISGLCERIYCHELPAM